MCGIVAYIGSQEASPIIIDGLKRLEYRGYDSAGIAVLNHSKTDILRTKGKIRQLEGLLKEYPLNGTIGIGHTRWATHGRPSEENAHPHQIGKISVVHNGIIENYQELKQSLSQEGKVFKSQTDTEVFSQLMNREVEKGVSTLEALRKTIALVKGAYAIVLLNEDEPDKLYVARHQSPLVLATGEGENFVASDVYALLPYSRKFIFLEDGDHACISKNKIELFDKQNDPVSRPVKTVNWSMAQAEKGGFRHFMHKEIFEQSRAFSDTLAGKIEAGAGRFLFPDREDLFSDFQPERIYLIACGTSYHAALIGKFYLEHLTRIPVFVDVSSEFRYRNPIIDSKTLVIAISQSGETADTLCAVKQAKQSGAKIISICNVLDSSIPRESDGVFYTHAGPEVGVAATKTFTTQILSLLLIAAFIAQRLGKISEQNAFILQEELLKMPQKIETILSGQSETIQALAKNFQQARLTLFIGRGLNYPIALEGALKLKEIAYIPSEGYAGGELKHGPIALIEQGVFVIALAPNDSYFQKIESNIEEVIAREAKVICITTNETKLSPSIFHRIEIPETDPLLFPLLTVIPLQLLAYEIACLKGLDVDQPRNLAKSVTVE